MNDASDIFNIGSEIVYCRLFRLFLIFGSLSIYLEGEVELYLLQAERDGVEVVGEEFLWIAIAFKKILRLLYMVCALNR